MNESSNNHTHPEDKPLRYFVPGELIVAVNHPGEFSRDDFVKNPVFFLQSDDTADLLINELRAARLIMDEPPFFLQNARIYTSQILSDREWVRTALGESVPFVGGKGTKSFVKLKLENVDDEALIYLASELELRATSKAIRQEGEQKVVGVSLNLLWSSAPQPGTTGGPGALPVSPEPALPNEKDDYEFGTWEPGFKPLILKESQSSQAQNARGKLKERLSDQAALCPIEVVILDTIPPRETLDKWTRRRNKYLKELLQYLNSSSGSLHYYDDLMKSADLVFKIDPKHQYHIKGHHYDMSDHGLFIAGIVHKIAPQAKIHLIEVLNEYGVGSLQSLVWGLQQIIERCGQDRWLIINSSLTISFSYDVAKAIAIKKKENPTDVEEFLHLLEGLIPTGFSFSSTLENKYNEVIDCFPSAISVAAAGNDNPAETEGEPTSPSRAPAAYGSVIGVGALTREGMIARYSNKADYPEPEGFYVFGGNVDRKNNKEDGKWIASKTDGILGVYTYESYPGEAGVENTSGWARWAGTSFASAVATGILAQTYECEDASIQLTDPEAIIKFLQTVAEEKKNEGHVLPVGQGTTGRNPRNEFSR